MSLEFLPYGLEFNIPVQIEVSYKGADLTDVNESKLRIVSKETKTVDRMFPDDFHLLLVERRDFVQNLFRNPGDAKIMGQKRRKQPSSASSLP